MSDEIIGLRIDGPIIREPYPLHEIISILVDFHSIFDQSYLVLADKKRMSKAERLNYQILASYPKPGSYLQELVIVCGEFKRHFEAAFSDDDLGCQWFRVQ